MHCSVSFIATCVMLVSAANAAAIPVTVTGGPSLTESATVLPEATLASGASVLPDATVLSSLALSSGFDSSAAPTATVFACNGNLAAPSLATSLSAVPSIVTSLADGDSFGTPSATSLASIETEAPTVVEQQLVAATESDASATILSGAFAFSSGFEGTSIGEPTTVADATQLPEATILSFASAVTIDGCAPTATGLVGTLIDSGFPASATLVSGFSEAPFATGAPVVTSLASEGTDISSAFMPTATTTA